MHKFRLLLLLLLLSGCTTVNCSQLIGERNTVKSDQDQSPSTKVDGKVPITTSLLPK